MGLHEVDHSSVVDASNQVADLHDVQVVRPTIGLDTELVQGTLQLLA
jgi:hypothetical protein